MRISDWSSDVCSSDLASSHIVLAHRTAFAFQPVDRAHIPGGELGAHPGAARVLFGQEQRAAFLQRVTQPGLGIVIEIVAASLEIGQRACVQRGEAGYRSEEHTSELQSLMRISYAVLC